MKFTPKSDYFKLLPKLYPNPPTIEEIDKAVDDFYRVLYKLNEDYYPIELTTNEFGTTIGKIKQTVFSKKATEEPNSVYETIEIEILLTFSPSGKIIVAWKEKNSSKLEEMHFLYKIKRGEEISFLMEDRIDESTALKNSAVLKTAREIAEKINDILAPNSVKFIKED